MKRVSLFMLLILAFVSFATVDSFADSSPPGVDISIDYELPGDMELLNYDLMTTEVRIAVFDCDLNFWPVNQIAINIYKNDHQCNFRLKHYAWKAELMNDDSRLHDQFSKPVNKHGITDKEAGYRQNINSYLV